MDHKEKDDFDVDIQACSAMDCTGLIPSLPQDEAEKEAYEDLYPYVTKAVSSDKEYRKAGRTAQYNAAQIKTEPRPFAFAPFRFIHHPCINLLKNSWV